VTTKLDLRYETPLANTKTCNVTPEKGDLEVPNAKLITPGKPELSTLWLRMKSLGDDRMPNFGSFVVDVESTQLIQAWITQMSGCDE
jgi:hypothetical protein